MKKLLLAVFVAVVFLAGTSITFAGPPSLCDSMPWLPQCDGGDGGDDGGDGSVVVNNTNENSNRNTNTNMNMNNNSNTNLNLQGQNQDQSQGQFQGQNQGQHQNATAVNKGVEQSIEMKFEDKRDHISPARAMETKADLRDHGDKLRIKAFGSVFAHQSRFTKEQATKLAKGMSDAKVEMALIIEKDVQLDTITVAQRVDGAEFMGYVYVLPDGSDVTLAQMEGLLMKKAMYAGATHIVPVRDQGAYLEGSSWNIGLGGGASILTDGGTAAIAPNGGFGFGKAKSNNEVRPAIMAELWHDASVVIDK